MASSARSSCAGPSLIGGSAKSAATGAKADEWRFYAFSDVGMVRLYDALPGQDSTYSLASVGIGSRANLYQHYNASVDVAVPLIEEADADEGEVRVTFRGWADF